MKYKVVGQNGDGRIFWDIPQNIGDEMGKYYELKLFLAIPNITKQDIFECFEVQILSSLNFCGEIDETILADYLFDFGKNLMSMQSSYADDYIAIIGQLFLGDYIDFYRMMYEKNDKEFNTPNLSQYNAKSKYETWVYFRDNFIYKQLYLIDINPIQGDFWANPNNWNGYSVDCFRTEKGTQYFNEILAPRFYNKYKDLEVEIDEKGNIIQWIGEIHR